MKKKEEEKKNKYLREYSLFSNIGYVLRQMVKFDKLMFLFMPLAVVTAVLNAYLWPYITKLMLSSHCAPKNHHHFKSSTFPQSSDISPTKR